MATALLKEAQIPATTTVVRSGDGDAVEGGDGGGERAVMIFSLTG